MRRAAAICLLAGCGRGVAPAPPPPGWAALPDAADAADRTPQADDLDPALLPDRQDTAGADAFVLLCPSDEITLTRYASAFHHDARVFVPSCGDDASSRRAFAEFRARWNADRPLMLAAAGPALPHLDGLLRDEVAGQPLSDRLVAAWRIEATSSDSPLAACTDAAPNGCAVTMGRETSWADLRRDIAMRVQRWTSR
jgi:hypothetical protein